jgi:hypothetical protein
MLIKLQISVANSGEVLARYDCIRVYRATTSISGTYSELTTATTRLRLEPGKTLYTLYDETGASTYWYKTDYYNSVTGQSSNLSDPRLGDDSMSLEGIMTVADVKNIYLVGLDLTDDTGTAFPDQLFEFGIKAALQTIEAELDLDLRPQARVERYDYDQQNYQQWGFLQLDHYPVLSVDYVRLYWPTSSDPFEFPADWLRLEAGGGQINIVPTSGSIAQAMILSGGYMPALLSGTAYLPRALEVSYTAGFAYGSLPYDLRDVVGMLGAFNALNTAGDLISGAGIANFSLSVDGLSQSIGTTSSPTNAGYGARILIYQKAIKERLPVLRKKYKNAALACA